MSQSKMPPSRPSAVLRLGPASALLLAACAAAPTAERELRPAERARRAVSGEPSLASAPDGAVALRIDQGREPLFELNGGPLGYVVAALERDAALEAARARANASAEGGASVRALPEPVLSYTEFLEELQTRTGPNRRRLRLDQSLPWPGVLAARGESADADAARVLSEVAVLEAERARQVVETWAELAFARERSRVAGQELSMLENLAPVVERRVEAGGSRGDWLELEIEVARMEERRDAAEASLRPLAARLAALCGLEGEPSDLPADLQSVADVMPPLEALMERVDLENPRRRALVASLEHAEARREVAQVGDRPMLGVGIEFVDIGDPIDPAVPQAGDDPFAVRLSVGLPIWRDAYAAERRAADSLRRAARLDLDAWQLELQVEVEQVAFELADAERKLVLYRERLVPRAREAYELTLSSYTVGDADLSDLIDAERALLELDLEASRALRDRVRSIARLSALAGAPTFPWTDR
jgi:cobalt-zinc-cadmium efflux system outer membrane protein